MRILYIGNWVRHGKFCGDEFKAARGFELEGHEVRRTRYRPQMEGRGAGPFESEVMQGGEYDLAIWTKTGTGISAGHILGAKRFWNCPQVMWHWDLCTDRQGFRWFWEYLPEFDLFCHTERCRFKEWETAYGTPCRYLDSACDPDYHKATGTPRPEWECDGGFIGDAHGLGQRRSLMRRLAKDFSVRAWSPYPSGWTRLDIQCDGPVYGDDIADACASAKIMLGSSATTECDGYWSNRIYTVMGSGGFFLTEYLASLFEPFGRHIHLDAYDGPDDCLRAVDFWLQQPDGRARVAAAGCVHVRENHTWQHRARQMIGYLEELKLI